MVAKALFSSATDEWSTPQDLFDELKEEFKITLDVCATHENAKCIRYFTKSDGWGYCLRVEPGETPPPPPSTLEKDWAKGPWSVDAYNGFTFYDEPPKHVCWMNPPYGPQIKDWVKKASDEAAKGVTTVSLLPARTDTKWWHSYVWDVSKHQPRENVEVRFLKGRLKFGGAKNSAPFPSCVVIFRGSK